MDRRSSSGAALRLLNSDWLRPILLIVLMLILWDLAVRIFGVPAYLVPKPGDVVLAMIQDWDRLLAESVPTMTATLGGFALSVLFGIPIAMLIAGSRTVEAYIYPLLVFSQSIPKVAIAPLFVVWFGFGLMPKVIAAFLLGFFPVVVSAVQGFKSVDGEMMDLARSMKASRLQTFQMVRLPHALPAIFAGLKVSITLAVVGAVVGEFVGSNSGIGFVLQRSIGNFELPLMFAALTVLALMGVVLFWVIDVLERVAIPWHASQRQNAGH
ncbi:NitT/TauT family transport system permease protein [Azospirillum agricola]|uniref:ABC transporter permease n=1 Tax=Azospirillum agricola TaxID=1720247 RepID=UPI001AE3D224|nr:ABC transporter permease [Azospirillum agricola]MBP2231175.1 NitT/TauT family transport system permease protein [Azospirillum agricola]